MTTQATVGHTQIALEDKPLVVCDVDEVVLEFLTPLNAFLNANGYELLPRSFRLTGNIIALDSGEAAENDACRELLERFFSEQLDWQTPTTDVETVLSSLSELADIVFLSAMPPHHYDIRRTLLDRHGLTYPLVATNAEKGPLIREIHGERELPLIFIDDMIYNLHSAKKHAPTTQAIYYMSNAQFRSMAPHPGDDVIEAEDWPHIEQIIRAHMGA
ncbi:hypothetical protein [Nitratireductor sp. XY-223]|uniref:hypothetical protein n=1 Tax=Nitratireductor sp. XY-223 TaxID=2561926 RepID=UPI0010A9AE4B|nr:hypothetical protein [Nitratireductor sp. XY-223]